jgi:hypothetical protein
VPVFRRSEFRADCERCGARFEPGRGGGVCARCRRILCDAHLHGSFLQRVRVAVGAPAVCAQCRATSGSGGAG